MKKWIVRSLVLSMMIMLGTGGCLRSASDEDFVPLQSRELASPLPPPTATWTPEPVDEPESEDPFDDSEIVFEVEEQEAPALALPAANTPEPPAIAQLQQPTLDPLFIEATNIVATRTQEVLDLTATAEGPPITFPTDVPTLEPFAPTPTQAAPPPGGTCIHTVAAGENLFRLSLRYNTTVADIAQANGISNTNLIRVGQQLTIPGCGTGTTPPGGGTGGPVVGRRHTVQQGETLFQLSMRYGVPVMTIASANGISNINLIYLGQDLVIP